MAGKRVFISFDYDNDVDLKTMLVGQAALPASPFEISDQSITVASPDWRTIAKRRIRASDVVAVICGTNTHRATGVAAELAIAKEEGIPYFLLWGRSEKTCYKPTSAAATDKVYKWTWENLTNLIAGQR